MKKRYLKKIILTSLTITMFLSLNSVTAYAVWQKDSKDKWNWIENNIKVTGWKNIDNNWYHFDSNGIMSTGWLHDNNKWYYLDTSGTMQVGWFKESDNKWYHLSTRGSMDIGWLKDNNKWYYLSSCGVMSTGWLKDMNEKWYYLSNDGSMYTGWLDHNGDIYYFNSNGEMITEKLVIDGESYDFSEYGKLISKEISGSIESDGTSNEEIKEGYVLTESAPLNIRKEPSISSEILGTIPRKSKVQVIGNEVDGFYKISYKDLTGWSSCEWIKFINTEDDNFDEDTNNNFDENVEEEIKENNEEEIQKDNEEEIEENNKDDFNVEFGEERTVPPSLDNKYYYSNNNIFYKIKLSPPFFKSDGSPIIGNCTWYAWGRIWELTGKAPIDVNFTGNGYEWWQANLKTGKYKTGNKPKVGALAVWKSSLAGSGGYGHVAVVEKIENGKVYISESSWHGSLFKYRELYNIQDLYGYIYLDEPNY
ncbi:CHAP domain-containing protein [Clostridium taeniosporum]|uniref:N-acetylmuramoyl-L-alanine amidase n=1 Tax=Clostridium taeniosporum TaxID=394958 RepID=A0A1D7XKG6_9CLOT|nr:CHAP domain-containing protein [Clostridium taeniosporum]AOR23826.1 ligand-binding protein SH3 [Clostridium taeniosporum]